MFRNSLEKTSWIERARFIRHSIAPTNLGFKLVTRNVFCSKPEMNYFPKDEEYRYHLELDGAFLRILGYVFTPHGDFAREDIYFSDFLYRKTLDK